MRKYEEKRKEEMCEKMKSLGIEGVVLKEMLEYVYGYEGIEIKKEEIMKRRRNRIAIAEYERCIAKRANGEQCSRRRGKGEYCGTHIKGSPYGCMSEKIKEKKAVWMEEIQGITYYVDGEWVYKTEDILKGKENVGRIGKYINGKIVQTQTKNMGRIGKYIECIPTIHI